MAAFAELVDRHAPVAKRAAVLWGAGADADDMVQEAFVKAYAALGRFRPGAAFRPWLLQIVMNETRNLHRSRSRRSTREFRWGRELLGRGPWLGAELENPESEVLAASRRETLLRSVESLPRELREVVTCRYLLELSEAESAIALNIPSGTVKSRLHRALAKLREEVGDDV